MILMIGINTGSRPTKMKNGSRYTLVLFMNECLSWGGTNPEQAIDNADSIAGYVIYNA